MKSGVSRVGDIAFKECFGASFSTSDFCSLTNLYSEQLEDILSAPEKHYSRFERPKRKSDGNRVITAPKKYLRYGQRKLKVFLNKHLIWPKYLHGGIENRSTITNAEKHLGRELLINLDVKDFFPSVLVSSVQDLFERFGAPKGLASDLSRFCCLGGCVPQGAPTSSLLTNVCFSPVDVRILSVIRRNPKVAYTRYVDDVSISGDEQLASYKGHIESAIKQAGFELSVSTITRRDDRQIVTGLIVNDKLRPVKEFSDDLEDDIELCLDRAVGLSLVADMYDLSKSKLKKNIAGRINHLSRFESSKADRLSKLAKKIKW